MPAPKKIFFSYSANEEDLKLFERLKKHFALYSQAKFIDVIGKQELFISSGDNTKINETIQGIDLAVPLLSTDFFIDNTCIESVRNAAMLNKIIIPVLLRSCEWQIVPGYQQYENSLLPQDNKSVLTHMGEGKDEDKILMEVAQRIKEKALPEIGNLSVKQMSGKLNYFLAAGVGALGIAASLFVYNETESIGLSALAFMMFACIVFVALKNVFFPNKASLK